MFLRNVLASCDLEQRVHPWMHRVGMYYSQDDAVGGGGGGGAGDSDADDSADENSDDESKDAKTYTKNEVEASIRRRLSKQDRKHRGEMTAMRKRMEQGEVVNSAMSKFLQKQGLLDEEGQLIEEDLDADDSAVDDLTPAPRKTKKSGRSTSRIEGDINALLERLTDVDGELAGAFRAQVRKIINQTARQEKRMTELEKGIAEKEETMRTRGLLSALQAELSKLDVHDAAIAADYMANFAEHDDEDDSWFLRVPDPEDRDETLVVPIDSKEIDEHVPAWFKKPRGRAGSGATGASGADSSDSAEPDQIKRLKKQRDALFAKAQGSGSDADLQAYVTVKKQLRQLEIDSGRVSVKDTQVVPRPDMPASVDTAAVHVR